MKPGDKVVVVDGTKLRASLFVGDGWRKGEAVVTYFSDVAVDDATHWVVRAADVFADEPAARQRLAEILAHKIGEAARALSRLRNIDPAMTPVLVRAAKGGGQ